MADYQLDGSFKVSDGSGVLDGIKEQLINDYVIIENCSDELDELADSVMEIRVSIDDIICDSPKLMERLSGYLSKFTDIASQIASIRISADMKEYYLFGIVMKKAQISMLKAKRMESVIKKKTAEETKKVLVEVQNGKINSINPITAAANAVMSALATVISAILSVLDVILDLLSKVTAICVPGDGLAFFPTPKALQTQSIEVPNINVSCNDFIPSAVKDAITAVETSAETAMAQAKNKIIAAKEAVGASSAAAALIAPFDIGDFDIPKIDLNAIVTSVNVIIQSIVGAEALPRYESLVPWNVKWMIFLLGSFEMAMKNTFGLPGYA